jgi:hemolysin activation/secretion protein
MKHLHGLATAAPAGLVGALLASAAMAQTPPPPPAELLRFEAPQRPITLAQPNEAACRALLPAGAIPAYIPDSVVLEGATVFVPPDLADGFSFLTAPGAGAETATQVAAWIDCRYAGQGYVGARSQVVQTATGWRVRVREGKVARLEVVGANPTQEKFIRKAFADVQMNALLNARNLKRGADAASRYGFWGVAPSVTPAEAADSVVLVLTVSPGPPGVFVSAQNASAPTVGTWSGGASLIFSGMTPLQERNIIGVFHDLTGDRQWGVQISSQALLTRSGLEIKGDLATFEQTPDEKPPNQDTKGVTRLGRIEARHPLGLIAGPRSSLLFSGRAGLEAIDQNTDLRTGPATVRDRLRVVYTGVQADYRSANVAATGFVSLRKGLDDLGASREGDVLLSRVQADPAALVVRFEGQASIAAGGFLLEPRLRAQYSDKPLLQYEELTFGGLIGGRAVDPGALYGDSGISGTLDVYGPAWTLGPRVTVRPAAFIEGAWARNQDSFGPEEMSGVFGGGGLRLSLDGRWTLDLLYATPIGNTVGVPEQFVGPKVSVTVSGGISF